MEQNFSAIKKRVWVIAKAQKVAEKSVHDLGSALVAPDWRAVRNSSLSHGEDVACSGADRFLSRPIPFER
jgi:hypothetical protein